MSLGFARLARPAWVVLVAVLVSGCIANSPADDGRPATGAALVAVLKCLGPGATLCNQEMTPDPERAGNEVTIAVNPTNPLNIVGGAKDYYPPDAGECVWDGIYVTHDGGITYEDRSFDGSPWRLRSGDVDNYEPNYASQFWCTTDPVAYFDTSGTLYYLLMAYQADPVTGSKTCQAECPRGALNDWAFNRAVQIIAVSDDGGDSFHTFTPVFEGTYPVAFHDKGWIAASPDGTIHVLWVAGVPGNLYFRSTDGGQTYSDPQILSLPSGASGQGSFLDVGPGSEVYATWVSGNAIQLRRSFDQGATWDTQRAIHDIERVSMPGHSERDRRGGYPAIATDRSLDSPYSGAVYYVWQNAGVGGATDVLFSASFDNGETFSEPIVVNDDRLVKAPDNETDSVTLDVPDPTNWQVFPTVSVSPGGVIDVSWMDTRRDPADLLLDQYYTYSLDGGATWSTNVRVRDAPDAGWDTTLSFHQNGMIFIGDYNDIDSSWGAAHPVWPDTRHGLADVFTAVVQRPLFATGWDEATAAALRSSLVERGMVDADHPFLGQ